MGFGNEGIPSKAAAEMLPSWRVIFSIPIDQKKSHAKDKVDYLSSLHSKASTHFKI